ncbi:nitrous oxide reductase [Trichoderma sp. SZMC 28014]
MKFSTLASIGLTGISAVLAAPSNVDSRTTNGAVFALTNAVNNAVVAFNRDADGTLTKTGEYPTGGHGQGVDFDSQGSLQLSADHKFLYAVNPASDEVTVYSVNGSSLKKIQSIYAGDQPLSITLSNNGFAYALDGSVASTGIFGFKVDQKTGLLSPITNSTIATSTPIGVPGTVTFSPDGRTLIVTNKVGSTLDQFSVAANGEAVLETTYASNGLRPFGAIFGKSNTLYVVESGLPALGNAGLSTYQLSKADTNPLLKPVTKSEKNQQTDGCWVIVTPDEKFAFTASFITNAISSYKVAANGTATLIKEVAASPGEGTEPVDLALSADGQYLYNLQRGGGAISGWKIQADGSLKTLSNSFGAGQGIPVGDGASGLAAY